MPSSPPPGNPRPRWRTRAARAGGKHYLVQHYESLYHGEPARVDATYRLPLRKICISTWLSEIMRDKLRSPSDVIVTPVDPSLFHEVPREDDGSAARADAPPRLRLERCCRRALEAVARVRARHPRLALVGFGVKPPRAALPYDEFHARSAPGAAGLALQPLRHLSLPSWDEGLGMPPMEAHGLVAPRWRPTIMAAAGTTRATARPPWWRPVATWRGSRVPSSASWRTPPSAGGWPRARARPSSAASSTGTAPPPSSRRSSAPAERRAVRRFDRLHFADLLLHRRHELRGHLHLVDLGGIASPPGRARPRPFRPWPRMSRIARRPRT